MAENIQIKINAAVESAQAAKTIGDLKKSLTELQTIAEENELGVDQFKALQTQIVQTNTDLANAKDRIGDIQDSISTLQGTPIERLSTSFGLLKQSIFNLDFQKAQIGVKGLVDAFTPLGPDGAPLKGLAALRGTLGNLGQGVTALGGAFAQLGKALLTNPIFLLAAAIVSIVAIIGTLLNQLGLLRPILDAIGAAVEFVTDAFDSLTDAIGLNTAATDKNLKATLDAEKKKQSALEETLTVAERIAAATTELTGLEEKQVQGITGLYVGQAKTIETTRLELLGRIVVSLQRELAAYDKVQKEKRNLTEEEKKSYDEIVRKIESTNVKIIELTADRVKKTNEALDVERRRSIDLLDDNYQKALLTRELDLKDAADKLERRTIILQEQKGLEEQLSNSTVKLKKQEEDRIREIIAANKLKIQEITDKAANDRGEAERRYNNTVTQLNQQAAAKRKADEDEANKKTIEGIRNKILAEENANRVIQDDEKLSTKQRLDAQIAFENKRRDLLLQIADVEKKTEEEKTNIRLNTIDKIRAAQNKFDEEQKTAAEKQAALDKAIQEFKKEQNADNLLFIQAALKAELAQIDLQRENTTEKEFLLKLEKEAFAIKQKLSLITQEAIQKEIDSQRLLLETRLNAAKIIKDNNLKVDDDVLKSTAKTQQLITDITTKGVSDLATINATTKEDRLKNIEAVKAAELALLQFNFEQEAVKRAEAAKTNAFVTNLETVDLELTKKFNAEKLAIINASAQQEIQIAKLTQDEKINLVRSGVSAIAEVSNLLFDIAQNNGKKTLEQEEKVAKAKFAVNKALQVSLAIIDGFKAVTSSLAQSPVAIGPVPNPAGIASLAFAITTSLANIGKILATQYKSTSGLPSVGNPNIPTADEAEGPAAREFTAPTFFGLGGGTFTTDLGPNQQRVYVLETDITSVQNRVSVIESRSVLE